MTDITSENVTVTTGFGGAKDDGIMQRTIRLFINGVMRFTGTFDTEAEAFQAAQEWLDDAYPDNEVTL